MARCGQAVTQEPSAPSPKDLQFLDNHSGFPFTPNHLPEGLRPFQYDSESVTYVDTHLLLWEVYFIQNFEHGPLTSEALT